MTGKPPRVATGGGGHGKYDFPMKFEAYTGPGPMTAPAETFEEFRALTAVEVLERAQEIEQRPRNAGDARPGEAAWRALYRDMRRARAATVGELKAKVVEMYAYRLGYGYLLHRYGRRDAFMPFEAR